MRGEPDGRRQERGQPLQPQSTPPSTGEGISFTVKVRRSILPLETIQWLRKIRVALKLNRSFPTTVRLRGYNKSVLEAEGLSFHLQAQVSTAYVRTSQTSNCTFTVTSGRLHRTGGLIAKRLDPYPYPTILLPIPAEQRPLQSS